MNKKIFSFIVLIIVSSSVLFAQSSYEKEIEIWKQKRIDYLKSENGWLNLVGLYWLQQGKNNFGSGDDVQIKFPKKSIPANAGYFELNGTTVTMFVNQSVDIKISNQNLNKVIVFSVDSIHTPIAAYGSLRWTIIKREDKIGVRLRDIKSPAVTEFKGIERFAVDSNFKVRAHLQKTENPANILITNIIGQTSPQLTPGKLVFTLQGKQYSLDALEEEDQLFIIFGDATSNKETYPSGRFLYASKSNADGYTILDFNKAFNPPCAFTKFATCPLPPKQNILSIAITAGEKNYNHN